MSTYLRKCLDIAPTAQTQPAPPSGPFVANDYRNLRLQSWWPGLRATTSYLRVLADWPSVQNSSDPPGSHPKDEWPLAALDGQIEAAHSDGMKIILLPYRYPRWANETAGIPGGPPDWDFHPWDRFARLADYLAFRAGTRMNPGSKAWEYGTPPEGFGPGTAWAGYVAWLLDRYGDRIAALEVVNEPNLQLWPQRSQVETDVFDTKWGVGDTRPVVAEHVAEMIETADVLCRARGDRWDLLAPGCSDSETVTLQRYQTIAHPNPTLTETFTGALLAALKSRGFAADERWVWAYHNYTDFERDRRHVVDLRQLLESGGWSGRRLDGGPEVWCTEGGVRLTAMGSRFATTNEGERRNLQARVMTEGLSRHHYAKGAGAGVGMITQYTTYADGFNSGVLETAASGGVPRPALAAWCNVPEYVASPVQRAAWRPQP